MVCVIVVNRLINMWFLYVLIIYWFGIDIKLNWGVGGYLLVIKFFILDFMFYNEYEVWFEIMKYYFERKYICVF